LTCLWDRVFTAADKQANERLCLILANDPPPGPGRTAYGRALEAELLARFDGLFPNPKELRRLTSSLDVPASRSHFWQLVHAEDPRIREFGRRLLLPHAGEELAAPETTAEKVLEWIEKLCPEEDLETKTRSCGQLPLFGASRDAVAACLRSLQAGDQAACTHCGQRLPAVDLDEHLRRAHGVYSFHGQYVPRDEFLTLVRRSCCRVQPDPLAWQMLERIAREDAKTAEELDTFLAVQLSRGLAELEKPGRDEILSAMADIVAPSERAGSLLLMLASSTVRPARHFAVALAGRIDIADHAAWSRTMLPLLARRLAPQELQVVAAARFLKKTGTEGPHAHEVLDAFLARSGKARSVERLRELAQLVGNIPLIVDRIYKIESRIRMRCPRCAVHLRRLEMAKHLWSEHGLLLDGNRVREPWKLVEDWIHDYRKKQDAVILVRTRQLGQHLDPERGLERVYRMILANHVDDVEARQVLTERARLHHASLCPGCYAVVPVGQDSVSRPLNESRGRLSREGYAVEVSERGFVPLLRVETPSSVVYEGREAGSWLTRSAASLILAGPCVFGALLIALLAWQKGSQRIEPVVLLSAAVLIYGFVALIWSFRRPLVQRAIDHAWRLLVPALHGEGFSLDDSGFLAGLAMSSVGRGRVSSREEQLSRVLYGTERALEENLVPLAHLAALRRLEIADLAAVGRDPVTRAAGQVARCFQGELPLAYVQLLLGEWEASWWTAGNLARLRVLLCDRAFEAGMEVLDLVETGHASPALADVIKSGDPDSLAQLRLLWSLRAERPWDTWSQAETVFQVAEEELPGNLKLLGVYPDLLLREIELDSILICGRGIVYRGILFEDKPHIELRAARDRSRKDYHLVLGRHDFHFAQEPDDLVDRLERWFHYYTRTLLPKTAAVYRWRAPAGTPEVRIREAVPCPGCRRLVLPRLGEVGETPGRVKDSGIRSQESGNR
jgi:hypothetical protein